MKVLIVGTSNSVMKNGWVSGFKSHPNIEVINYSIGRSPCLMHLATLIKNRSDLEAVDFILLDHSVNDLNYYIPEIGDNYFTYIYDLLKYVSLFNVPVLNLIFPIYNSEKSNVEISHIKKIKNICEFFGVYYIDLNKLNLSYSYFEDNIHLKREVAYFIGYQLSIFINKHVFSRCDFSGVFDDYKILSCDDLLEHSDKLRKKHTLFTFKNSLGEFKYINLEYPIDLSMYSGYLIVAIAYFNETGKTHTFDIETSEKTFSYRTTGDKFFLELLDQPILIEKNTSIKKSRKKIQEIRPLMNRCENLYEIIQGVNISYLVLKNYSQQAGHEFCTDGQLLFDMSNLFEMELIPLEFIFRGTLNNDQIDTVRDIAFYLENIDVNLALKLMNIAHILRPNGERIIKKISDYKSTIRSKGEDSN